MVALTIRGVTLDRGLADFGGLADLTAWVTLDLALVTTRGWEPVELGLVPAATALDFCTALDFWTFTCLVGV